jgi:pimeloyl-ACP methyl ester carboxylesterase
VAERVDEPVSLSPVRPETAPPLDPTRPPHAPPGYITHLPGRGEIFYRYHRHPDPAAPTLLLLHGWTASADLQFFTAYEALAEGYSFVAVDHRGHGRGIRNALEPFTLEDAADDAAALVRILGLPSVIAVGYSMGGPIALHLWHRHRDLVAGVVLEATALEWRDRPGERLKWRSLSLLSMMLRAWWYPHTVRAGLRRLVRGQPNLEPWVPWIEGEVHRNEVRAIIQAGRALAAYDARPFASSVDVPAGVLLTTADRLVKPSKQRALARAVRAEVLEVPGDHLSPWVLPDDFAAVTRRLVDSVARRVGSVAPPEPMAVPQAPVAVPSWRRSAG